MATEPSGEWRTGRLVVLSGWPTGVRTLACWPCAIGARVRANWARALVALAEVVLSVDRDDEAEAALLLREELDARSLDDPAVARAHRAWLAVSYVLDPQSRPEWDALDLAGTVGVGRACARAIVALREGAVVDTTALRKVDAGAVRSQVPTPWLAEIAVTLTVGGHDTLAEEGVGRHQPPRPSRLPAHVVEAPRQIDCIGRRQRSCRRAARRRHAPFVFQYSARCRSSSMACPPRPRSSTAKRYATCYCCWSTSADLRAPGYAHCFGPISTTTEPATTCA